MRLFEHTNIDFMARRKQMYMLSGAIILFGLISLFTKGIGLGIDLAGGTEVTVEFSRAPEISQIREVMTTTGFPGAEIKTYGDDRRIIIKTLEQGDGTTVADRIRDGLLTTFAGLEPRVLESQKISPKIGDELRRDAVYAIILSLVAIGLYIAFRFKFIYGVGAIVALFHDVLVTIGVISILDGLTPLTNFELDLNMIAALLTLTGLSVNDTVVIFDRIRENQQRYKTLGLKDLINKSLNETLSRTIITNGTIFAVTMILFLAGGEVNRGFGFALTFGCITGTYSTIYVASSVVLDYTSRKGRGASESPNNAKTRHEPLKQGS